MGVFFLSFQVDRVRFQVPQFSLDAVCRLRPRRRPLPQVLRHVSGASLVGLPRPLSTSPFHLPSFPPPFPTSFLLSLLFYFVLIFSLSMLRMYIRFVLSQFLPSFHFCILHFRLLIFYSLACSPLPPPSPLTHLSHFSFTSPLPYTFLFLICVW